MSEDPTKSIPDTRSFEERVLSGLASIRGDIAKVDARLTTLEDKVDARLRETRPIWESMQQQLTDVQTRMAAMEKTLNLIRVGLGELYGDSVEVRARIALLERERAPAD